MKPAKNPLAKNPHREQSIMAQDFKDFATLSREYLDAFVRVNATLTRGFEELSKTFFALASRSIEEAVEASKSFSTVKSPQEAIELQTKLAQESLATLIAETKKVHELSASIVKDASAPLVESLKATVATSAAAASALVKTTAVKKAA
jgi:phasin family protein